MRMWAVFFLVGCLPEPNTIPPIRDAEVEASSTTIELTVYGTNGDVWPSAAAPRRPRIVLRVPGGAEGDPEPVMLIRGPETAAWLADLERAPILVANRGALVPVTLTRTDDDIVLSPDAPLELGAVYTIAVAGWATHRDGRALDAIVTRPLQVASGEAGARVVATFPPDRSAGAPTTLPHVFVAFDDAITGIEHVFVEAHDGTRPSVSAREVACEDVGLSAYTCVRLDVPAALAHTTEYAIVVTEDVRDRSGASVGYFASSFTTASGPLSETTLSAPSCTLDERAAGDGRFCALVQDDIIRLRSLSNNATYGYLDGDGRRTPFFAPRGEIALARSGLAPDTDHQLALTAYDAAGNAIEVAFALRTEVPLADVIVSEVRHDPSGPEPAQEYVELANGSDVEIALAGFSISDRAETLGDVLPQGARIAPFGRVLLVPDAFDPDHADDVRVPNGVVLVRIGSSIASSGISNGGEALFLRDASARRVAEAPAIASVGEGRCIVRTTPRGRLPGPDDYVVLEALPCTPGF